VGGSKVWRVNDRGGNVVVRGDGEMFISQRYDFLVVIFSLRKTKKNELQNIYHMCDNSKTDDFDFDF
jgi:hypothetical protein